MKNNFRIISLVLAAAMLFAVLLTGCSSDAVYKVTVKNAVGEAYTEGVIVRFMQNGEKAALQPIDKNGVAEATLSKGDYDVELDFTSSETEYYYEEGLKVTSDNPELEVSLSVKPSAEPMIVGVGADEYEADYVGVGSTYVELEKGMRNYFIFVPDQSGNYEFTIADGAKVEFGYYGMPSYIQEKSAVEVKDNVFTISVGPNAINTGEGGTATYVLGVDAGEAESCVIGIKRLGDHIKTLEDYPWTVYEATVELAPYTLPADAKLNEFDLMASTDEYKLVLNEEEGFYHLDSKDGPLVVVSLGEDCGYIDCFKTIVDHTGIVKYFFDDEGEFEKKESYSECILEYLEVMDEASGMYPLTEDLMYIIQQFGDHQGWWDPEHLSYRFKDMDGNVIPGYNNEIAWLLMCYYID